MSFQFFIVASLVVLSTSAADVANTSDGADEAFKQSTRTFFKSASSLMEVLETVKITEDGVGIDGRGSKLMRLAIPLIVGFKIASLITASIGVLKAFVVKTVIISGLSLIVSVALAAKFILDKLGRQSGRHSDHGSFYYSHPYSSPSEPIPSWEHPGSTSYDNPSSGQSDQQSQWSQPMDDSNNNLSHSSAATAQRKTSLLKPTAYKISMYKKTVKEVSNK